MHRVRHVSITAAYLAIAAGAAVAFADDPSCNPGGINSRWATTNLGLTGNGILIGQVEDDYAGLPGTDANGEWFWDYGNDNLFGTFDAGENDGIHQPAEGWIDNNGGGTYTTTWRNFHPDVTPFRRYLLTNNVTQGAPFLTGPVPGGPWTQLQSDPDPGHHATRVAGVMIGNGAADRGVARQASLVSSSYFSGATTTNPVIATQHIAQQHAGVRAVNHSYGLREPGANYNGTSQLTLGMDWVGARYNILNIVAGDQTTSQNPGNPSDNYNGMNIIRSVAADGVNFNAVDAGNVFTPTTDGRNIASLVAPGVNINVPISANGLADTYTQRTGTSYAAPHVTGTVALLQQYGGQRAGAPRWDTSRNDHRVFKAVLMNSADKIIDNGAMVPTGYLMGMEKTLTDTSGNNWLSSEAYNNPLNPLDNEMGAGHLNAKRAVQQYWSGEYGVGESVPLIGWAQAGISPGGMQYYYFNDSLLQNSFLAITLCWDRVVALTGADNTFDPGETFSHTGLADLDLRLERDAGGGNWIYEDSSISIVNSTEHIFHQLSASGMYRIRVHHFGGLAQTTDYGLAWWAVPTPGAATVLAMAGLFGLRRRR